MTVLLPRNGKTVNDVVRGLDASGWATLTRELQKTKVDLRLPKFRLEYFRGLKPDLVGLGMGIAFSDQADFSGISRAAPLTLTRVDHKTFVEVNEEGTEAAAVTITGVGVTSLPQIVPFRVDRPFIFAIRERLSGAILFLGKMTHLP
jgi:serpin B